MPVLDTAEFWWMFVWGSFAVGALLGWGAGLVVRGYVWFLWVISGLAVWVAQAFVANADPEREYEGLARALVVGPPLAGWLLGLAVGSLWIFVRFVAARHRSHEATP